MNPYRMPFAAPAPPVVPVVKVYTRGPDVLASVGPAFHVIAWICFAALVVMRFAP